MTVLTALSTSRVLPATRRVLYVGDMGLWRNDLRSVSKGKVASQTVGYHDVTAELLRAFDPHIIYSELLNDQFDSTELAQRLQALGFSGQYCAVVQTVPMPQIIENEVRLAAPGVQYDLLLTGAGGGRLH